MSIPATQLLAINSANLPRIVIVVITVICIILYNIIMVLCLVSLIWACSILFQVLVWHGYGYVLLSLPKAPWWPSPPPQTIALAVADSHGPSKMYRSVECDSSAPVCINECKWDWVMSWVMSCLMSCDNSASAASGREQIQWSKLKAAALCQIVPTGPEEPDTHHSFSKTPQQTLAISTVKNKPNKRRSWAVHRHPPYDCDN